MDDPNNVCCGSCLWWMQGAAPAATMARKPGTAEDGLGVCTLCPPVVIGTHHGATQAYFPEVHRDRTCSRWVPREEFGPFDPDDGERFPTGDVVPFEQRRAA